MREEGSRTSHLVNPLLVHVVLRQLPPGPPGEGGLQRTNSNLQVEHLPLPPSPHPSHTNHPCTTHPSPSLPPRCSPTSVTQTSSWKGV